MNFDMPVISIDFDGTIVEDEYPNIGDSIDGARYVINHWYNIGCWIIINSCRYGIYECDMISWLNKNNINYHTLNENLQWRIEMHNGNPRKIGADFYIDNKNIEQKDKVTKEKWVEYNDIIMEYLKNRNLI